MKNKDRMQFNLKNWRKQYGYYEKLQQECRKYKVIKKLKSKTSKKIYLKFENGSIHEVSPILKYEDIKENHKLKKCDF